MNVSIDGEYIPLIALPKLLREKLGRSPNIRTIKRWRKEGVCGGTVILETTRRGHHLYTTRQWVDEFFRKQEAHHKANEALVYTHKLNFKRAMQRKKSRRANRAHQAALAELEKIYGDKI